MTTKRSHGDTDECILRNQLESMHALSLLLRYAMLDLVGKAGELDGMRDDLMDRYKATTRTLASIHSERE